MFALAAAALLLTPAPLAATTALNSTQPQVARTSDDPVQLINMGASYERAGKIEQAREFYMAAVASRNPVEVQLANGRWVDSREAARNALHALDKARTLAVR